MTVVCMGNSLLLQLQQRWQQEDALVVLALSPRQQGLGECGPSAQSPEILCLWPLRCRGEEVTLALWGTHLDSETLEEEPEMTQTPELLGVMD